MRQITVSRNWIGFTAADDEGIWGEPCYSNARPGRHARWFTFTLTSAATVRFELSGDDQYHDAYTYLRVGRSFVGFAIGENDDERPYRSRPGWLVGDSSMEMRLEAGTYTLEATTDGTNIVWKTNAGTFELRWRQTD